MKPNYLKKSLSFVLSMLLFCLFSHASANENTVLSKPQNALLQAFLDEQDEEGFHQLIELFMWRYADLNQDGKKEYLVLWQTTRPTSWNVFISVLDERGQELDTADLGRTGKIIGIETEPDRTLIKIENARHLPGDVFCCPNQRQLLTFILLGGKLQKISTVDLARVSPHP